MIIKKDLTFVVQGAVGLETGDVLKNIRRNFKESTIILSTWYGSNVDNLDYDQLVLSKDPGVYHKYFYDNEIKNNINRQLISTFNGLKKVTTKYVIKTRTDNLFKNTNILHYLSKYRETNEKFQITKERILVLSNLITINPKKIIKLALHPSDFIVAGLTEDIKEYFNIPLMNSSDLNYFSENKKPKEWSSFKVIPRYTTEQYILIQNLKKKNIQFKMDHALDLNGFNTKLTMDLFGDSFCLVPTFLAGLENIKHPINFKTKANHIFTFYEWKYLVSSKRFYKIFDFERIYYLLLSSLKYIVRRII